MTNRFSKSEVHLTLAGLLLFGLGGCTTGDDIPLPSNSTDQTTAAEDLSVDVTQLAQHLDHDEMNFLKDAMKDDKNSKGKLKPIFDCVEKIDSSHWRARFGYENSGKFTEKAIGRQNFFFPKPENRGQPTKFQAGRRADVVTVPFDGHLLVWVLDNHVAAAHRMLHRCPSSPVDAGNDTRSDAGVDAAKDIAADVPKEAGVDTGKDTAMDVPPSTACSTAGVPKPNGTPCDDGVKCTTGDVCTNGVCGGTKVTCAAAADTCHLAGVCSETTGACTAPTTAPDGAPCNDGNLCTQTDTCTAGVCTGANPVQCSGTSACTAAGTCNPMTGMCTGGTPKANGTMCDDGKKCTTGDVCTNGTCGGTPVTCAAPTACHTQGVCLESTGVCSNPVAADGTTCNDGNLCTQTDTCTAGVCTGANPVQCSGTSACTTAGTCNPMTGTCAGGTPKPAGTSCDDGLKCTTGDVCNASGTCGGTKVTCPPAADACHVAGTCAETTGSCASPTPVSNGAACDDGKKCTTGDVCTGGVCGGAAVTCPNGGTCDDTTGMCGNGQAACLMCEQGGIAAGLCDPAIGCDNLTDANDKTLCLAAQQCVLDNHCAVGTKDVFIDCFCGTAAGVTCLTAPTGPCVTPFVNASKATTTTDAATRIFDLMFPLGHATQKLQCDHDFCQGPPITCPL